MSHPLMQGIGSVDIHNLTLESRKKVFVINLDHLGHKRICKLISSKDKKDT